MVPVKSTHATSTMFNGWLAVPSRGLLCTRPIFTADASLTSEHAQRARSSTCTPQGVYALVVHSKCRTAEGLCARAKESQQQAEKVLADHRSHAASQPLAFNTKLTNSMLCMCNTVWLGLDADVLPTQLPCPLYGPLTKQQRTALQTAWQSRSVHGM